MTVTSSRVPFAAVAVAAALGLGACASDSDVPPDDRALARSAEDARKLAFLTPPVIERTTREAYLAENQTQANGITEEALAWYRGIHGRLGFFSATEDLRRANGAAGELVGAYYSSETKKATIIEPAEPSTVVHELVHALQDQHFDLAAFVTGGMTSDEALARRALVEGDATVSELVYTVKAEGRDPTSLLPPFLANGFAERFAANVFAQVTGPRFFTAQAAFAYGYGARHVASVLGMAHASSWSHGSLNRRYTGRTPASTQEIIAGIDPEDPIVEVGLEELPAPVARTHAVEGADRLGEWYIRVLAGDPSERSVDYTPSAWDGDQLLVLRARDGEGKASGPPVALVWTTAWDSAEAAARFATALARVQRLVADDGPWGTSGDGENVWLERAGDRVVLVKNLERGSAELVASEALAKPAPTIVGRLRRGFVPPEMLP